MTGADKTAEIIKRLEEEYPDARIALHYSNPFELLVATILSAQCTDEIVNKVTSALFTKYRSIDSYASADLGMLEQDIRSTGFYHNKAKNILNTARLVLEKYDGRVPQTMVELVSLPGVAHKTANIVLYNAYGKTEGIAVDTHVKRLSKLLGITQNTDPQKIEKDLMQKVPGAKWGGFSYLLIEHGRAICKARKPQHRKCVLNDICPSAVKL
ncbi:endonuclease III [Chloroflexota bacterium]